MKDDFEDFQNKMSTLKITNCSRNKYSDISITFEDNSTYDLACTIYETISVRKK